MQRRNSILLRAAALGFGLFAAACGSTVAGADPSVAALTESGTSGSRGDALPCTQKAGADTDDDCAGQPGRPRKLDCDAEDTSSAVAAGCVRTKPGDSDVCCPLSVSGTPEASSSSSPSSEPTVSCKSLQPILFTQVKGYGPYCAASTPNKHCAFGEHCCIDTMTNTQFCAETCPAPVADVGCFGNAECGAGQICCAKGTPKSDVCSYEVIADFKSSACKTSCATDEYQACGSSAECNGKTCTPAWMLDAAGTATGYFQANACL